MKKKTLYASTTIADRLGDILVERPPRVRVRSLTGSYQILKQMEVMAAILGAQCCGRLALRLAGVRINYLPRKRCDIAEHAGS